MCKEQSFARQLPILPGDELKPDDLPAVFDVVKRQTLQDKFCNGDSSFQEFATNYRAKYEEYMKSYEDYVKKGDPVLPKPSQSTQALEKIYIGPDGLFSLLSRRLANALALEIKK